LRKNLTVIGAGFSGLSAAAFLAREGHAVTLLEKNTQPGGRCQAWRHNGFVFDMGPSWYWMPDVFERFFGQFGKKTEDYYTLQRLDPSYRVFFPDAIEDLPANLEGLYALFEKYEKGAALKLKKFLDEAAYKYRVGMQELVFKPGRSAFEFFDGRVFSSLFRIDLLKSMSAHIQQQFKHAYLRQLLEFPVLFLGAKPEKTPALYSLMNYADMQLGTWYPMGGMYKITEGMTNLVRELGVNIVCERPVTSFSYSNKKIDGVKSGSENFDTEGVVAAADYHHVEQHLLNGKANYDKNYWDKRQLAPSCLLFYVGVSKKLKNLLHHNLFFDADFARHAADIYDHPAWPQEPLFYVCAPSVTDASVAPAGHENLFMLIPVSTEINENDEIKEKYFDLLISRVEKHTGNRFRNEILFKRSFSKRDFISEYNSFKGNAYGLANTLRQTAFLKPKIYNKKIKNLFYAGQLTVPGPGVPPALISGELAAKELLKYLNQQ
jgi:phytoene desaturase